MCGGVWCGMRYSCLLSLISGCYVFFFQAASCFGLSCEEIDVLGGDQSDNAIYSNHQVYRKLAASGVLGTGARFC